MRRQLYDESHELLGKTVRTFVEREIAPNFERWESDGIVPKELYRVAGTVGLMGVQLAASDVRYEAIIQEEFGRSGMLNAGQGTINHNVAVAYFRHLADDDAQRSRWFPGLQNGELLDRP